MSSTLPPANAETERDVTPSAPIHVEERQLQQFVSGCQRQGLGLVAGERATGGPTETR